MPSTTTDSSPAEKKATQGPSPFDRPDSDAVLLSSDNTMFLVHRNILSIASTFFSGMFFPGIPNDVMNGKPSIRVDEDANTLDAVLRYLYPVENPDDPKDLAWVIKLLEAGRRYRVLSVADAMKKTIVNIPFLQDHPFRVFAIACRFDMELQASCAAKRILKGISTSEKLEIPPHFYVPEMDDISAGSYYRLIWFVKHKEKVPDSFRFAERGADDDGVPESSQKEEYHSQWVDSGLFQRNPPDIKVVCSDGTEFPAHKLVLSIASPVFASMIERTCCVSLSGNDAKLTATPNGSGSSFQPEILPAINIIHDVSITHSLLRYCYGMVSGEETDGGDSLAHLVQVARAARGYRMSQDLLRALLRPKLLDNPIRGYFIALTLKWEAEVRATAALLAESQTGDAKNPPTEYVSEMEDVSARAYFHLLTYVEKVQKAAAGVLGKYSKRQLAANSYNCAEKYDNPKFPLTELDTRPPGPRQISSFLVEREIANSQKPLTMSNLHVLMDTLIQESGCMKNAIREVTSKVQLDVA